MADPIIFDGVSSAGGTYFGAAAKEVIIVLEDDRRIRIQLPVGSTKKTPEVALTKPGRAILAALADNAGKPMKGATVARAAGYPYTGSFRQNLKALVLTGEVTHDESDGYSIAVD